MKPVFDRRLAESIILHHVDELTRLCGMVHGCGIIVFRIDAVAAARRRCA